MNLTPFTFVVPSDVLRTGDQLIFHSVLGEIRDDAFVQDHRSLMIKAAPPPTVLGPRGQPMQGPPDGRPTQHFDYTRCTDRDLINGMQFALQRNAHNIASPDELRAVAESCPIVANALRLYDRGVATYDAALRIACLALYQYARELLFHIRHEPQPAQQILTPGGTTPLHPTVALRRAFMRGMELDQFEAELRAQQSPVDAS